MSILLQLLINGIIAGSTYALVAIGLSMVFGILRFINFAQGEIVMLGAYLALFFMEAGMPFAAAAASSILVVSFIGVMIDRAAYRPLRQKDADSLALLIASIGVSIVIQNVALLLWGPQIRIYDIPVEEGSDILGASITRVQLLIIAAAFAMMLCLDLFIRRTRVGAAMRAVSDDRDLARIVGIDAQRIIFLVWVIGSMLAAAGGILIGMNTNLSVFMGLGVLIKALTAVILGGIGDVRGAMLGGMAIGMAENISLLVISPQYKDAVAFGIMIILLLVCPRGLFGKEERVG